MLLMFQNRLTIDFFKFDGCTMDLNFFFVIFFFRGEIII